MFESLSEKLEGVFKKLSGQSKVTEANIKDAMREVKLALLEADVNFKVVKDLISKVTERAIGQEVITSLSPSQLIIKIVNDELTEIMGGGAVPLLFKDDKINIVMLVGLHGSGKTTFAGKLGKKLSAKGRKPLLVACDIYRPAAIKQLQVVGEQVHLPTFSIENSKNAVKIAIESLRYAKDSSCDVVIIDTAGRLHIDEGLMDELKKIKEAVNPDEIIFVADAMTGQEAVNIAKTFNDYLDFTGICLTKLDGDTRGGAALSIRYVTNKPIKFVGVGEKLDALEDFYPDRMASRILGMGDVVSLVEKAQEAYDEKKAKELEEKFRKASFTLEDMLDQFQRIKKLGSLKDIMAMVPGMGSKLKGIDIDDREIDRVKAIIQSMTPDERLHPEIINGSRKRRIAKGCGRTPTDVNKLLAQFNEMKKMMKMMTDEKAMRRMMMNVPGAGAKFSVHNKLKKKRKR